MKFEVPKQVNNPRGETRRAGPDACSLVARFLCIFNSLLYITGTLFKQILERLAVALHRVRAKYLRYVLLLRRKTFASSSRFNFVRFAGLRYARNDIVFILVLVTWRSVRICAALVALIQHLPGAQCAHYAVYFMTCNNFLLIVCVCECV